MSATDSWFCLHGGSWLHQQDAGLPAMGVQLYLGSGFAKEFVVLGHSRHPPPLISCNAGFKGFKTLSHLFHLFANYNEVWSGNVNYCDSFFFFFRELCEGSPLQTLFACETNRKLTLPWIEGSDLVCYSMYMLWFNFILGSNFLSFCFWLW